MDRKLQQRLVGTLVLACFVLLIAPVLFDADGRIPEKITNIPPLPKRPDLSHIKIVENNSPVVESLVSVDEVEYVIEPQVDKVEPAAESVSHKVLWSIQIASFRDPKKASEFKVRLREAKFDVYVREKLLSDGSLFTQVFVGPVTTKDEAIQIKDAVKTQFGEQGLVVKYRDE